MVKLNVFSILKNKVGFTATELLIVTTLLSSLPVSRFIGVRNKAFQTQCASNLRQIGLAVNMFYVIDVMQDAMSKLRAQGLLKSDSQVAVDVDPIWLM